MNKILSVLVTVHNSEYTFRQSILSAIGSMQQSLSECEIIIINDSSIDNSAHEIQKVADIYPTLVKVFNVNFSNVGMSRNFGVEQCQGKYITMFDSDDLIVSHGYDNAIGFLKSYEPDMYLTKLIEVKKSEHLTFKNRCLSHPVKVSKEKVMVDFIRHKKIQGHFIGQFIKSTILKRLKFPEFKCYEDHYLFPEVVVNCERFIFSGKGLYLYIKSIGSLSACVTNDKIRNLVSAVLNTEKFFSGASKRELACHWIDIYVKHYEKITDGEIIKVVKNKIKEINVLGFILDPFIRISYKRKLVSILTKINHQ